MRTWLTLYFLDESLRKRAIFQCICIKKSLRVNTVTSVDRTQAVAYSCTCTCTPTPEKRGLMQVSLNIAVFYCS